MEYDITEMPTIQTEVQFSRYGFNWHILRQPSTAAHEASDLYLPHQPTSILLPFRGYSKFTSELLNERSRPVFQLRLGSMNMQSGS